MILKALYDYYDRYESKLPPANLALVDFEFAIVLDSDGRFKRIERLGNGNGLPLRTIRLEERTSAPIAHCMGDNGSYVLGLKDVKPNKPTDFALELKKNAKNHAAFKNNVEELFSVLPHNHYVKAVYSFYQNYGVALIEKMAQDPEWPELCKVLHKNITFLIDGEYKRAVEDEEIIKYCIERIVHPQKEAICLITGEKGFPVCTTYSTFVAGGKSNAKLVAFQISSGYDSYGKQKGYNAPISEEAEFKYTTALLSLLSKGSPNKYLIGSRTFLFWASKNDEVGQKIEMNFLFLLGLSEQEDDPNGNIEQVRKVFKSIYMGELKTTSEDTFYILGLAPNAARIAVTYWAEIPLGKFAETICRHFDDMEVVDTRSEKKPYMSLRSVLSTVTLGGKSSDATPNLPDAVVKSIFQGLPYPQTLFASCIRRIRAESGEKDKNPVHITRAAIIKAYLNRLNDNQQPIRPMLDKENTNQGYLCGRLFAVLDKIQEEANNQHSIRERYMNSASSTPAVVFSTILNLSNHHAEKLSEGRRIYFEKLMQEIISKIDANGFCSQLDLQDQGRFFIGFYHQRQDFFTKNEESIIE